MFIPLARVFLQAMARDGVPSLLERFVRCHQRLIAIAALAAIVLSSQSALAQPFTFAGDAQHTARYGAPAQPLQMLRWSTSVNLTNSGGAAHYGAPVITAGNTVLVSARTTATGFQVKAFNGVSGVIKYTLATDYILPSFSWVPVYQPVIAPSPAGTRLYYAGAGGTVFYIEGLDSDTPTAPVRQCFYTNVFAYTSNASAFNSTVFINTPITTDTNGSIFFGFRVQGTAPAPLNTTNGGFARIDPAGNATYVLAGAAAADNRIVRDSHNCAPALSNDGSTLYVAVKGTNSGYAYLLGLDSVTLATKYRAFLRDPRNGNNAGVPDDGTASPMVGPDGDVYFGVSANPNNGSRGFLLHFNEDLTVRKTPGGFGWDYTAGLVPTNMVPGYKGTSSYLLFAKYNSYADIGDGEGINRLALLDPNATQIDPNPLAGGLVEMREVLTVISPTPDANEFSALYPQATREWCINTAAVNPASKSIFIPCEDGRIYRWDLAANSLAEAFTTGPGVGQPYVPTVIGPDGAIYTLNGGKFFALGGFTNIGMALSSSAPDLRTVVTGQPVTFTAIVTNLNAGGLSPTGTVTFQARTHRGLTSITNVLAANVPLSNGVAMVTSSTLEAGGSYPTNFLGNHLITATYNGDANFPVASVSLMQKVHASGTTTILNSTTGANNTVIFTATVTANVGGLGLPSGLVSFWDRDTLLAQMPLGANNSVATCTITNFSSGSHAVSANYASDTIFASSEAALIGTPPVLGGFSLLTNGVFHFTFTNVIGAPFSVLGSTDLSVPLADWTLLGPAIETQPGQFQFTDTDGLSQTQRFYRVRSP